jgi:hypothetical protein
MGQIVAMMVTVDIYLNHHGFSRGVGASGGMGSENNRNFKVHLMGPVGDCGTMC